MVFSERPVVNVALIHFHSPPRWRLVVGAVGLVPLSFEFDRLAHLNTSAILGSLEPTRDLAGSEDYKRHLTSVMIERARAGAEPFERGLLAT